MDFHAFDLWNAAQTFQRVIGDILRGFNFAHTYVGDCLISSPDRESHPGQVDLVFERLERHGNIRKCRIRTDSLDFLGYIIDDHGIRPLESKVVGILDNSEPTTGKQLRTLNSLVGLYRIAE